MKAEMHRTESESYVRFPDESSDDLEFDHAEIVSALARVVDESGGLTAWSSAVGVSRQNVWSALNGRCGVSDVLARKLGFCRVVRYVAI